VVRTVRIASVFIAGPADTDRHARIVIGLIESLNKVLGPRVGVSMVAYRGGRDASAGVGRPQARINPLVRECTLFIGVFRRRFGSPTGTSASGTSEEFRIARKRHALDGNDPEIILFFEKIPRPMLDDPGDQLKALLRFRRRVRPALLWVEFKNEREFNTLCLEQLVTWLMKFGDRQRSGPITSLRTPGRTRP
jgi:hypothetical protein